MSKTANEEICAFHYHNKSTLQCSLCGLPICDSEEDLTIDGKKICALCSNSPKASKFRKYIQLGTLLITLPSVILIFWLVPSENSYQLWAFLTLIPVMIGLLIGGNRLLTRIAYKGLEKHQMILPLIRYFEASGNDQFYKIFLKNLKKLSADELEEVRKPLYEFLIPAILFNYSKLQENWKEDLLKYLELDEIAFAKIFTDDFKTLLINIAVHDAKAELSKFIFYLGEITENDDIIHLYIKAITSDDIKNLKDEQLKKDYDMLLEELYLYEEIFYSVCDRLNLQKEKEALAALLKRYEPPAVPKSAIDAIKQQKDQILQMQRKGLVSSEGDFELADKKEAESEKTTEES
ncbi:MAG: hypothetical protein KAJ30_04200 [Candidatus Heimdallarchaeota archaeon]|nr:hypothetical protein [Candidatus Heimdallarchaeota archaeon]